VDLRGGAGRGVRDGSVDMIYSVGATRHLPLGTEVAFLQECARILRAGGLVLLTFVTPAVGEARLLDDALGRYLSAHGITDRRFEEPDVLSFCRGSGLEVLDTRSETSHYLYGKLFVLARGSGGGESAAL